MCIGSQPTLGFFPWLIARSSRMEIICCKRTLIRWPFGRIYDGLEIPGIEVPQTIWKHGKDLEPKMSLIVLAPEAQGQVIFKSGFYYIATNRKSEYHGSM